MSRRPLLCRVRRRGSAALAATLFAGWALLAPTSTPPAAAVAVPDAPQAAGAGAAWLAAVAPSGVLTTGGVADWGLTAAGVFAQAAGGRGATGGAVATDQLATHLLDYASDPTGTARSAGPIAKLLVVAVVQGRDPSAFGGWDLRSELLSLMTTEAGANRGRFRSKGAPDTTNGFSQSFAVIGLARSAPGTVPPEAIDYLLGQQCPAGGFRLFFLGATCTNDASSDIDATAMSVQALATARSVPAAVAPAAVATVDAAIDAGLDWMESVQNADGSFTSAGPSGVPNSNSTGLAAQALRGGGRTEAADRAATWLRGLQLDCSVGVAPSDRGAIAYGDEAYDDTVSGGRIDELFVDQFVRSTADGALGLAGIPFATLSATSVAGASGFDCSVGTTTTTVPGASTTIATPTSAPSTTTTTGVVPTSTVPTSTVPTSTVPTSTGPTSTTIAVGLIAASSDSQQPAVVEGISASSGSGSGSSGSGLAISGLGSGRVLAAAVLLVVSGVLFAQARRLRR